MRIAVIQHGAGVDRTAPAASPVRQLFSRDRRPELVGGLPGLEEP